MIPLLGCAPGPRLTSEPTLDTPDHAPLSRVLRVQTEAPAALSVALSGPGVDVAVRFPGRSTFHEVVVNGAKPDRGFELEITLQDERGEVTEERTFDTDPLPDGFPRLDVVALDADAVEPGYRLLTLESGDRGPFLAAVDAWDGEVAYLYDGPENLGDVEWTPEGTFVGLGQGVVELSPDGELSHRWNDVGDPADPAWVPVPFRAEHHEVTRLDADTFVTLTKRSVYSEAYPRSEFDPRITGPATLEDVGVVVFRRDGSAEAPLWYGDALDTGRIGFDSLDRVGLGYDWVHGNAVVPLPDGGWLASARHQDALFALDADGGLRWILASPAGWSEPFVPFLLALDGAPFYHQHGPSLDAAGNVYVFDNHNDGHDPYEPAPTLPPESRVVSFAVDEAAGTATQRFAWRHPEHLLSEALGNATALPGGTVLACYGFLDAEDGQRNVDRGLGKKISRIVEIDPDRAEPVSDLRFWYPADVSREGIKTYRAVPTPTLYPAAAAVERVRP